MVMAWPRFDSDFAFRRNTWFLQALEQQM